MQLSLYLSYIYYRRLFSKGDILTIMALITVMVGALYTLYLHYESWYWVLFFFPLSTFSYHNNRKDLSLLKTHPKYVKILIGEYFIENIPFIFLLIAKGDFLWGTLYVLALGFIAFLPQRNINIIYPFSLGDPMWHCAFRKYKLLLSLPFLIGLVVIARVYENPNLAFFALGATGFVCCIPYFEREHFSHICIASKRGKQYLYSQLMAGIKNTALFFSPVVFTYIGCFGIDKMMVLPLCLCFPLVGVLTKYAFFTKPIPQSFALIFICFGVAYLLPLLLLPYCYYLAIQNLQKYQYATNKSIREKLSE